MVYLVAVAVKLRRGYFWMGVPYKNHNCMHCIAISYNSLNCQITVIKCLINYVI